MTTTRSRSRSDGSAATTTDLRGRQTGDEVKRAVTGPEKKQSKVPYDSNDVSYRMGFRHGQAAERKRLASGGSGEAPASVMLWVCDNCGDLAECEPGDECEVCCEGTIQRVEYAPVRASSGEAPADVKQREFLEKHEGRMGRVDGALAEARGEGPAGLTREHMWALAGDQHHFDDWSLYKRALDDALGVIRVALRAPSSTGGREESR